MLTAVQLLILAHIAHWLMTGSTMTPVEPSEAMQTVKDDIINAGTVLLALALLSTLILGRWFCGWGCHVLLLQDLCGWVLKKTGVRPAPFRSRLLVLAPTVLGLYMFVWPLVYRIAILPWTAPQSRHVEIGAFTAHFVTTDFWATFPGVFVAIPFLGVCGFLTVYLLGQKGYCTYGCPYGGLFAPLDEWSPMRIRVTDACSQCGHCTAVCTSNVRVHEEVRDFRMVVDPGCMKCMDCVSVCPKEALYFGWGKPAALASARSKGPRNRSSLSWGEEIALGMVFTLVFFIARGAYGVIPLLFASGIAACVTFLAWKTWRLFRSCDVNLHRWVLRKGGVIAPAGRWFAAASLAALLLTIHTGIVQGSGLAARLIDSSIPLSVDDVFSGGPTNLDSSLARRVAWANGLYQLASGWNAGGIALPRPDQQVLSLRRAWLAACEHDFPRAESLIRSSIEAIGEQENLVLSLVRVLRVQDRRDEADEVTRRVLGVHPTYVELRDDLVAQLESSGRVSESVSMAREGLYLVPNSLLAMRRLSLLLIEHGGPAQLDEGIDLVRQTIQVDDQQPLAYLALSRGLVRADRLVEAEVALREGLKRFPDHEALNRQLGTVLVQMERPDEARRFFRKAVRAPP